LNEARPVGEDTTVEGEGGEDDMPDEASVRTIPDPSSPEFNDRYDAIVSDLHEGCPIGKTPVGYLLAGYEDVRAAANDWETFSSSKGTHPWVDASHFRPTAVDPPRHEAFRRPFLKVFAAQAVGRHSAEIRERARGLIREFRHRGECELNMDFSRRFVGGIFFETLLGLEGGLSHEMLDCMYRWLMPPFDPAAAREYDRRVEDMLSAAQAGEFRSVIFDAVLRLEEQGEPVSWTEKCSTLGLLIVGGLDTTVNTLNGTVLHLAQDSATLQRLVDNRNLIPAAVEEGLRLLPGNLLNARRVMREVEIQGLRLCPGDQVMLGWAMSSRDPSVFADPLTFDLDRSAQPHVVFGAGIHRCIGSHLARFEMQIALEELLDAIPNFRLAPGAEIRWHTSMIRGPQAVPLIF
jgi:cytochrome P450